MELENSINMEQEEEKSITYDYKYEIQFQSTTRTQKQNAMVEERCNRKIKARFQKKPLDYRVSDELQRLLMEKDSLDRMDPQLKSNSSGFFSYIVKQIKYVSIQIKDKITSLFYTNDQLVKQQENSDLMQIQQNFQQNSEILQQNSEILQQLSKKELEMIEQKNKDIMIIDDKVEIIQEKQVSDKKHSNYQLKSKIKILEKIGLAKIKQK